MQTCFVEMKDGKVALQQWQKVEQADGKKRTKIVEKRMLKDELVSIVQKQTADFLVHCSRVKAQYTALNNLKEKLPEKQIIVQMDFAENFICMSADEVQSAYWNSAAVTLHPVVVYFKEEGSLKHKNYVIVSDDHGHNIGLVYAFLKDLVSQIKEVVGDLEKIHYWTDSPSSQYRNKTAFYIISDHINLFCMPAEWNYFECGHGKGPCDGIGGTAKRTADMTVKQGKCIIQDASDFYKNVSKFHHSALYMFVSTDKAESAREEILNINKTIIPLKGTMQMHYVKGIERGTVLTATTSCYCDQCMQVICHYGSKTIILKNSISNVDNDVNAADHTESIVESSNEKGKYKLHDWVAVTYNHKWYVGKITDFDEADGEYEVTFLRKTYGKTSTNPTFKWPLTEDILDITVDQIKCKVDEPVSFGRSGRCFVLKEYDYENILNKTKNLLSE